MKLTWISGHVLLPQAPTQPVVLVTGGVGMAPFRSLVLEAGRLGGCDLHVLQVQRGDFLYQSELRPLVTDYSPVPPDGFIPQLSEMAAALPHAAFYLCGSRRLKVSARDALLASGISKRQLPADDY